MGNENQNSKDSPNDLSANSIKIISVLVFVVSIGLLFVEKQSQVIYPKIATAITAILIYVLVNQKVGQNFYIWYSHALTLLTIIACSYLLIQTRNTDQYYLYTYSLVIFLLSISLTYRWHYGHQIIAVVYSIAILALVMKLNPQYYLFFLKDIQTEIIIAVLAMVSVLISAINFASLKIQAKNSEIKIEDVSSISVSEAEHDYQNIFENLADGLFRSSIEGKILLANISFAKILGYNSVDEVLNLDIIKDIYVESLDREKLLKILVAQKRVKNYRLKLRRKDNIQITVKVNERIVVDESGQPQFIEGSIQDITQQVAAEEEKLQQLEELRNEKIKAMKEVNSAVYTSNIKAQFLASMSHEIKTPINSIIGFLTLIEKKMFDSEEELQEFAQNAKTAADSLLDIINNVLDISKIEAGKMELDEVEFNFKDEIQKAIAIITPQVTSKNLTLTIDVDNEIPVFLNGDPVRFRQVILNILSNSVKYTDNGEIILKVSVIKITQTSVKLKVTIIDTGRGIPKDKMQLIFKPYTQVKQKKWTEKDGTGLGLMITKQLVELMDGEIQIISEEGIGTTVEFTAFLKTPKSLLATNSNLQSEGETSIDRVKDENQKIDESEFSPQVPEVRQIIHDLPEQKIDSQLSQLKKNIKRILLVEDNPISQKVEKKLLSDIGYDVEAVSSAYDAIEAIKTNIFHLVLMDIEMPDMDGLTATQKIRNLEPPTNQIPVIAVTAHSSMKDREKCLAAGMDDYIAKPININFMKIIIDQWLNK